MLEATLGAAAPHGLPFVGFGHAAPRPEQLGAGSCFARYQLLRCIGSGGMGNVYEAVHVLLRKRVALKILHAPQGLSPQPLARFLREAETTARIQHPNVVAIVDVGVEHGVPFLVMDLLEGEDLSSLLRREGRLSIERALDLIVPVVAGLVAVHQLGIVHRDIKPENVFMAVDMLGGMVPKIVDFGVSKDVSVALEQGREHTIAGTPCYMAPEQVRGSNVLDGRTDQYAVGVMLYQCLAGLRPFESPSLLGLMHAIDAGEYRPLGEHRPELPAALEAIIRRAMSCCIDDRFESSEAFGRALLAFASERTRRAYESQFESGRRSSVPPERWSDEALSQYCASVLQRPDDSSACATPVRQQSAWHALPAREASTVRRTRAQTARKARPGWLRWFSGALSLNG